MKAEPEIRGPRRGAALLMVAGALCCLAGCTSLPPRLAAELQPDPPGANHFQKAPGADGAGQSVATR